MAKIEIRPAISSDINQLIKLDHSVDSDYVFQVEQKREETYLEVQLRQIHLPRSIKLAYPLDPVGLKDLWQTRSLFLISICNGVTVGYLAADVRQASSVLEICDVVVDTPLRRQGIASAMLIAAVNWAGKKAIPSIAIAISPKNYPGIALVRKLGFSFCGYNEYHYPKNQMALFFGFAR